MPRGPHEIYFWKSQIINETRWVFLNGIEPQSLSFTNMKADTYTYYPHKFLVGYFQSLCDRSC